MSRSNPTDHSPNPCQRWFQWHGQDGIIFYYDKEKEANMEVGDKFSFILLDRLAVVKGWHDASDSGITSNEVRDTKGERLVVRAFKGGVLVEGFYASIKDRVYALGGHFTASLYIAYKDDKGMKLGNVQFKGAALNAWVDFERENRDAVWKKAVKIVGYTEGKKGKITFRVPKFSITDITEQTDNESKVIDEQLQVYLKNYFSRTRTSQAATTPAEPPSAGDEPPLREPEPELPPTGDGVDF